MVNPVERANMPTQFSIAWRSLANSRFLPLALLTIGTASNAFYAHTPLVALAVASGLMLPRRRAIVTALLLWLVNQGVGFGLRGYPLTATAAIWGLVMGLGTAGVVIFASWRPGMSRDTWRGHGLWMGISLLIGFGLYQGLILLVYPLLADGHWLDWAIVSRLFIRTLLWTGAIALGHSCLLSLRSHSIRTKPS
jgi:hypothetical protein